MTSVASSTASEDVAPELLPGYYVEPGTGALLTLPWPGVEALPVSLGPHVIRWAHYWLRHHLNDEPWRFTRDQRRFLHLWYSFDPVTGRWPYRTGVKRGAKGTGKDPLCAAMTWIEACGPVIPQWVGEGDARRVLVGHGKGPLRGEAVGRPHRMALVQVGANSEDQGKDVLRVANGMVSQAMADRYRIDLGVTQSTTASGSRIELLTNSEKSAEGDPATAIFLNETHHMTKASGGQALAGVARRNAAKSPGGRCRVCEFTNAHLTGEESVAEDGFDAWQKQIAGKTKRRDILYDSREAPPHLRLHVEAELLAGLEAAYADAPWVDLDSIMAAVEDSRTPPADSVRYYFNGLPTNELAWVKPRAWDTKSDATKVVADRDPIALFLDCSKSVDSTGLVGCRVTDGHVFVLGVWQRPHGDRDVRWLAPRDEVDATVAVAFSTFDVQWFGVDPSPALDDETEGQYWAPMLDKWHRAYRDKLTLWASAPPASPKVRKGNAVSFDMRMSKPGGKDRNIAFTEEAERTAAAVDEDAEELTHDGNSILRLHVINARRRRNPWGISLSKQTRGSTKLIDLAVSMVGARLGRRMILNAATKPRSGRVR